MCVPDPSVHLVGHSDSLCLPRCPNPSQLFYHSAPLPPRPPLRLVLLSCTRMRCSDMPTSAPRLSLVLCVCLLKRLQGNSLPGAGSRCFLQLPAVWGGRQQDAVGEKWLCSHAAALRQNHCTGQVQVGLGLCCCCSCFDLAIPL